MQELILALLPLRSRVSDPTLLDWLDLEQLLPERPCRVRRADLEAHWQLTQPALHRRLRRLQRAGLLDYETEHGTTWINRLGPVKNCDTTRYMGRARPHDVHRAAMPCTPHLET